MVTLKIVIEEPQHGEEDQIIIKCRNIDPELLRFLTAYKSKAQALIAYKNNEIHKIAASDIYYIETVDNKTFLYCEQNVYELKQKLYELEGIFAPDDFMRISKSVIVNLTKVKSLIPVLSGRLEAVLMNNEKVIISRQYVNELKKNFGI
jgi:DNA-binding LytR/AlgR family response regulator